MFLNNFLLSSLEDINAFFVFPYFYDLTKAQTIQMYAYPYGIYNSILTYSEPAVIYLMFWLSKFIDPHIVYNLLVVTSAVLAFISIYKFIGIFNKNRWIQSFLGLNFVFSPYFIYQSRAHPQLMQVWMPIMFLYFYFKNGFIQDKISYKRHILLGLFLGTVILTSNYLGYFLLLFLGVYTLNFLSYEYYSTRKINYSRLINTALMLCIAGLFSALWLYPFITANFISNDLSSTEYLSRPLEDFTYFSSRPWYYVLPSVDNPWIGGLSESAISLLQTSWKHYLTNNYFKTEHAAVYMGIVNLVLSLVGLLKVQKNSKRKYYNILYVTNLILIIFTFPPFIIINSYTIYLPSYLLYVVFPMFRALTRLGFLINTINLVFVSFGYAYLFELRKSKSIILALSITLFSLSSLELYVPFTVLKVSPTPQGFIGMESQIGINNNIAVYPKAGVGHSLYWTRIHKNYLINPINYRNREFDANKFTNSLNTCQGLLDASNRKVNYIVVYAYTDDNFFESNDNLTQIYYMPESNGEEDKINYFYKIHDMTLHPAIYVYKLNNNVSCK